MGEVVLPAGAEVDVPPPEAAEERLGILVVVRPEFTGLAGVVLLGHIIFSFSFSRGNSHPRGRMFLWYPYFRGKQVHSSIRFISVH